MSTPQPDGPAVAVIGPVGGTGEHWRQLDGTGQCHNYDTRHTRSVRSIKNRLGV